MFGKIRHLRSFLNQKFLNSVRLGLRLSLLTVGEDLAHAEGMKIENKFLSMEPTILVALTRNAWRLP
jgi:hypothetical protein